MTFELDEAIRELLVDYAGLQAEHQRLIASPYDAAKSEVHERRLYDHFRRAKLVLEQLRQKLKSGRPGDRERLAGRPASR